MSIQVKSITTSTAKYVYTLNKEFKTCVITYLPKAKNPRNKVYAQCSLLMSFETAKEHWKKTQILAGHPKYTTKKVTKIPAER